jgi:putative Ca2+/H+ antiporter (TMEM165/GDT1 family)
LQKPTDLPSKPHDIPHPVPDSLADKNPLDTSSKPKTPTTLSLDDEAGGVIQPFHSFILSFTMIIFSEIGDKTFLVAALMAMRHPRLLVFSAAFSALIVMTVLSAVMGHAVPAFLSERFTHMAAAVLFLVFGAKLMREGLAMSPDDGVGEEMREVEQELEEKEQLARHKNRRRTSISPYALESGRVRRSRSNSRLPALARSPSTSPDRSPSPRKASVSNALGGLNNLFSLLLSPAWVQTFVMTFLGEWGDRSQIATVAMAAGSDYWWVTGGAIVGHGLCTTGAVIGGRAIAGKISMRNGMLSVCTWNSLSLILHSHPGRCDCLCCLWHHLFLRDILPLVVGHVEPFTAHRSPYRLTLCNTTRAQFSGMLIFTVTSFVPRLATKRLKTGGERRWKACIAGFAITEVYTQILHGRSRRRAAINGLIIFFST